MSTPFRQGLALFLCVQPVLWMSDVALAQAVQPAAGGTLGVPVAPTDTEVIRAERGALNAVAPAVPPLDQPIDPDRYVCGPGDVLELNFWGAQNFKLRVVVDVEGRAFVPKVGYFELKGKTLTASRQLMRDGVARYFPRLSFEMTLAEPRTFLVQVANVVQHPGSYPARAIDRVSTVVGKAGGLAGGASRRRIAVRRLDGSVVHADLLLYALTGDVRHDPNVLDGDIVDVPFEKLAATIGGAVNRPGRYELVTGRDLAELLDLGGGLAPSATQQLPIRIVRRTATDRQEQREVDFADGALPRLLLEHEDVLTVPSVAELQQSVMVIGALAGAVPAPAGTGTQTTPDEVSATRRLPFVAGDSVRTLLERVGGVGPLADLSGAYVLRNGKPLSLDLYALVMLRDLRADRAVELGDTLVVPFKRRSISIEGAVFKPGPQPYHPSFGVAQYVSLAGGLNRFAQPLSEVRVVTPDGQVREYGEVATLEPGSSVVVPERNFSRAEIVQILLGVGGMVLSGVAVVLAARK
jgi:protein involved in polysaccharide export with SLBB domain